MKIHRRSPHRQNSLRGRIIKNSILGTTILSSSKQKKPDQLLTIDPGPYFKLAENQRTVVDSETTGLVVTTYNANITGETIYHVVLVDGELLLIPGNATCLKEPKKL